MKRISFFLALTLLLLSFGLASAQTHHTSLDNVVGEWDNAGTPMLTVDADNEFHIRITNNGTPDCVFAPAFAFQISSTDGAEWGGITETLPFVKFEWVVVGVFGQDINFASCFSSFFTEHFTDGVTGLGYDDGAGGAGADRDIVGFAGVVFDGDIALWEGMDTIAFVLTIHPTLASDGKTICFDYVESRTDGFNWGWNGVGSACAVTAAVTTNDGQHCYGVGKPPDLPPVFVAPATTISGSHCTVLTETFLAEDPDPGEGPQPDFITYSVTDANATIDANTGAFTYSGDMSGVGSAIQVTITATEEDNPTVTEHVVNIELTNVAPEFTEGCDGVLFAQNGVLAEYPMVGSTECAGDDMTMVVVDQGGIAGLVEFNGSTLEITGDAGNVGEFIITLGIGDGNADGAECTITVTLSDGARYGVTIEKTHGTLQGGFANVALLLTATAGDIGGFNFLVSYDASALTFQGATAGNVLEECRWEYFTYRFGADGNCNGGCPSGLVRIVGIAETNNGPNHPEVGCDYASDLESDPPVIAALANLSFLVSNDRTLECQYVPIRFFWVECGDNTISNDSGTVLYIASTVKEYPGDGANLMDTYTALFPSFIGPELICGEGDKVAVKSDIDFLNGGIDIVCADSIDDRGDLNLDGLAYTIADAVMYSNYFVFGMTALVDVLEVNQYGYVPHYAGSVAASDVNADGLSLTVADLVYLIRVVVGDAQAYDKVSAVSANLTVGSSLSVDAEMGAAYIVLAGNQTPVNLTALDMKTAFDGENTRVLVWSQTGETFTGEFLSNVGNVISSELASATGSTVMAKIIPENFALGQNYPNPFNPATSIELSLPVASDYTLTIYNVTGQVVTSFTGSGDAGYQTIEWDASNNASGVYFYKLTAGNFSDTKKMVLLK